MSRRPVTPKTKGSRSLSRKPEDRDKETGPERRCIVTGESGPKERLIRFVAGPDGMVVPDVAARLPGRGFYVSPTRDAIETAVRRKLFARGAKKPVTLPDDIAGLTEAMLVRHVFGLLGQARGAGQVFAGLTKVEAALGAKGSRQVEALFLASDAGRDAWRRTRALAWERPVISLFTSAELSLALGRENVVHGALTSGGLADSILRDCFLLAGFRSPAQLDAPPGGDNETKGDDASGIVES